MMLPNFILPAKSLLIFYKYFLYCLVLQHTCPSLQRRSSGFHSILMSSGRHPVSSMVTVEQGTLAKWFRNSIPGLLSQKKSFKFLAQISLFSFALWPGVMNGLLRQAKWHSLSHWLSLTCVLTALSLSFF